MATKILCFIPAFGHQIQAATFLTSHALSQALGQKNIQMGVTTMSFPDIAELRSMALTIWYDTMPDTEYLLFIDSDMGFQPDMVLDMLLLNEPLVGSIYAQRKHPLSWAGSGTGEPQTERRGNFMKVEGVGMGCTLIRRDVVTKMLEQMPELIDERLNLHPAGEMVRAAGSNRIIRAFEKLDIPDRGLVSEDLSFCIRWRRCGGEVWAAIGYRISHVGLYDYAGRYLDVVEQSEREALAQQAAEAVSQASVLALPATAGGTATGEIMSLEAVPVAAAAPVKSAKRKTSGRKRIKISVRSRSNGAHRVAA